MVVTSQWVSGALFPGLFHKANHSPPIGNVDMNTQTYMLTQLHHIICKTSGFHGGDYEVWRLLGCYAMWLL
jgi:hypothetical protein